MKRSNFVLAVAVGSGVTTLLLAYIGITYLRIHRYGTGLFAFGGMALSMLYTITYVRDWRRMRRETKNEQ